MRNPTVLSKVRVSIIFQLIIVGLATGSSGFAVEYLETFTSSFGKIADLKYYQGDLSRGSRAYNDLNREAELLISGEDPRLAYDLLKKAMEMEPSNERAYINFGYAHARLGEYNFAVKALDMGLSKTPSNSQGWLLYSQISQLNGNSEAALVSAKEAVARARIDKWEYFAWLGHIESLVGEDNVAVSWFDKACVLLSGEITEMTEQLKVDTIDDIRYESQTQLLYNPETDKVEVMTIQVPIVDWNFSRSDDGALEQRFRLQKELTNCIFSKAVVMHRSGRSREAEGLWKYGFNAQQSDEDAALFHFAFRNYGEAAFLFEMSTKRNPLTIQGEWAFQISRFALGGTGKPDEKQLGLTTFYNAQILNLLGSSSEARIWLEKAQREAPVFSYEYKASIYQLLDE